MKKKEESIYFTLLFSISSLFWIKTSFGPLLICYSYEHDCVLCFAVFPMELRRSGLAAWHVSGDRSNAGGGVGSVAGAPGATDEVFLAAQEAAQAHRDSQGRLILVDYQLPMAPVTIGTREISLSKYSCQITHYILSTSLLNYRFSSDLNCDENHATLVGKFVAFSPALVRMSAKKSNIFLSFLCKHSCEAKFACFILWFFQILNHLLETVRSFDNKAFSLLRLTKCFSKFLSLVQVVSINEMLTLDSQVPIAQAGLGLYIANKQWNLERWQTAWRKLRRCEISRYVQE